MTIALRHRDVFGVVATIGGPLNVRYNNIQGVYGDDFDPATYRERTAYEPEMIIAYYYLGIVRRRAGNFRAGLRQRARRERQGDPRQPGRRAGGDRHPPRRADDPRQLPQRRQLQFRRAEPVVPLARRPCGGLAVDVKVVPGAQHNLAYIEREVPSTCQWLANHLLPAVRR